MDNQLWADVDRYISDRLVPPDPALDAALEASSKGGLPPINVAPNQGKLLQLLVRICGASRVLEVGTLGGYSTIWLARGLPAEGRLVTLELVPKHAEIAWANIERAGLSDMVEIRIGRAVDSLEVLTTEAVPPFDFVFIDADKENNSAYLEWALRLTRPGSVIVVDNVVRNGAVVDPERTEPDVLGTRRLNDLLSEERRVSATEIQTVGVKGYDGFAVALVLE